MNQKKDGWLKIWYETPHHPLSLLLLPLSWLFRGVARLRRQAYSNGLLRSHKLVVPVIIVGNISVGGTGKTPLVIWLAKFLQDQGFKPGIISRGYGGQSQEWPQQVHADSDVMQVGDEPVVIVRQTGVPLYVSPDRFEAGSRLLAEQDCDILISDDGLQHYSLQRDFEICVIDSQRRHGNGRCLPAGPLREPTCRLNSVDAIVCNGGEFEGEFSMYFHAVNILQVSGNESRSINDFQNETVHAIAGIGNPDRFFESLRMQGLKLIEHAFPDHYVYQAADLTFNDNKPVIMTEKDAVKCLTFSNLNLWYVSIEAQLPKIFEQRLQHMLKDHN